MAWKSYLYYLVATAILAFLITQSNGVWGMILTIIHLLISFRILRHLYNESASLKDCMIFGLSLPLSVLICFAAIYQQQGVSCGSQNLTTSSFLMCLKVSTGNFIGHMVVNCQASGDAENVAIIEPVAGWLSLLIAGYFIGVVLERLRKSGRPKE